MGFVFVEGDREECVSCGSHRPLDISHNVCEECFVQADNFDGAELAEGHDGEYVESDEERQFRLAEAALDVAVGTLEQMEESGEKDRLRKAINEQAWAEIAEFVGEDEARAAFFK